MTNQTDNTLIMGLNLAGVAVSYGMLGLSLWLSTDVPLATKGFWGMSVLLLTLSLINFVRYRFDARANDDRLRKLEAARDERLLAEYMTEAK